MLPDFADKLTWLIASTGFGMVALPHAFIVAAANWLIALSNDNHWVSSHLQPFLYQDDPKGYWLIFGHLAYNQDRLQRVGVRSRHFP